VDTKLKRSHIWGYANKRVEYRCSRKQFYIPVSLVCATHPALSILFEFIIVTFPFA
jgi:hypothetical protein